MGERVLVLGVVEGAQVRSDRSVDLLHHVDLVGGAGVGVATLPDQRRAKGFLVVVEYADAAACELLGRVGVEQQRPAVEGRVLAQYRLDLRHVEAKPRRAPHVGHHVRIARVELAQASQHGGIEMHGVRQLGRVERCVEAGFHLALRERSRRGKDHVVAGAARGELGFQRLVFRIHVVVDLDAGGSLEVADRVLGHVVGPVVDIEHLVLNRGRRRCCGRSV